MHYMYTYVLFLVNTAFVLNIRTSIAQKNHRVCVCVQVIFMFLVLLVLAVVSSLGYSIWTSLWADKMWYLYMGNGTCNY